MPEAAESFDPEVLLHDALSSVALSAFQRDVDLWGHVDARLPAWMTGRGASLAPLLREGLIQSVTEYAGGRVAVALWEAGQSDPEEGRLLIEVCATRSGGRPAGRVLSTM